MAITDVVRTLTATIAAGQTVSDVIDLGRANALVGIQMPGTFVGTSLTFQASADGSTYVALYDRDGQAVSVVVSTSRYIYLDPAIFAGVPYLKVVSGATETGGAALSLVVRPV